jgi:hypothetical protein
LSDKFELTSTKILITSLSKETWSGSDASLCDIADWLQTTTR